MNIAKEKMVSVVYELKYDDADAQLIEKVEKDNPLTFLYGTGSMLEHFEKNL
jgi:FKBP-type peptidyl-prolyl cis-trans isomerase SlyD